MHRVGSLGLHPTIPRQLLSSPHQPQALTVKASPQNETRRGSTFIRQPSRYPPRFPASSFTSDWQTTHFQHDLFFIIFVPTNTHLGHLHDPTLASSYSFRPTTPTTTPTTSRRSPHCSLDFHRLCTFGKVNKWMQFIRLHLNICKNPDSAGYGIHPHPRKVAVRTPLFDFSPLL